MLRAQLWLLVQRAGREQHAVFMSIMGELLRPRGVTDRQAQGDRESQTGREAQRDADMHRETGRHVHTGTNR